MANVTIVDCSLLSSRSSFPAYIQTIRDVTTNNFSLVSQCKPEVCNALWGSGNPDISGIGMIVGYFLEQIIAFVLVFMLLLLQRKSRRENFGRAKSYGIFSLRRFLLIALRGGSSFQDCACTFVFATQLACIVVLARLDFGISAAGMGDSTAKITWAVSLLTMLPLMYIAFDPALLESPRNMANRSKDERKEEKGEKRQQNLQFLLFALCWLLSIYPFLSRMMETFGTSAIGNSGNSVISNADWNKIENVCVANVTPVSNEELVAMDFFAVLGSIFVCLFALTKIFWLGVQRQHPDSRLAQSVRKWLASQHIFKVPLSALLLLIIPVIAASQLWAILRWRSYQSEIAEAAGDQDMDGEWAFGQIAAITIFLPVLVQIWFGCLYD